MAEAPSFYYEILSQYKRVEGRVIEAVGNNEDTAQRVAQLCVRRFHRLIPSRATVLASERRHDFHISGVIFLTDDDRARESFARILLGQEWAASCPLVPSCSNTVSAKVEAICEIFEDALLYQTPEIDQWFASGKDSFQTKVSYFVQRSLPVMFCLPAFPCKSTNPDKTASTLPDGAEYEALTTLHAFCKKIQRLYLPGCVVDIVSDGHVFSDCIGTDDDTVTQYTKALQGMMDRIVSEDKDRDRDVSVGEQCIRFQGLASILHCTRGHPRRDMTPQPVFHPVSTKINDDDDKCRAMLLATCRSSTKDLQYVIKTKPEHSLTSLYRGFSRFMCEDLRAAPGVQNMSGRQRVKLANQVGLEMIQRNQAYSHLVELTMPRHVRLSIHAHANKGPKFAVCLLPRGRFQVVSDLRRDIGTASSRTDRSSRADVLSYHQARNHLHIPTPWHGVLVEIEGETGTVFVCKAGLVRAELERKDSIFTADSGYVADCARGGRYLLTRK